MELCFASTPRLPWGALVPEVPGRFPSLVSLILRLKQVEDAKVVHQLMLHSTSVATDHDCASLPGVRINELRHPRMTELARERELLCPALGEVRPGHPGVFLHGFWILGPAGPPKGGEVTTLRLGQQKLRHVIQAPPAQKIVLIVLALLPRPRRLNRFVQIRLVPVQDKRPRTRTVQLLLRKERVKTWLHTLALRSPLLGHAVAGQASARARARAESWPTQLTGPSGRPQRKTTSHAELASGSTTSSVVQLSSYNFFS